jgi:hypothetical protein
LRAEGIEHCQQLAVVEVEGNAIASLDGVQSLAKLPKLCRVGLRTLSGDLSNPVCDQRGYFGALRGMLPSVAIIDGTRVLGEAATALLATQVQFERAMSPANPAVSDSASLLAAIEDAAERAKRLTVSAAPDAGASPPSELAAEIRSIYSAAQSTLASALARTAGGE